MFGELSSSLFSASCFCTDEHVHPSFTFVHCVVYFRVFSPISIHLVNLRYLLLFFCRDIYFLFKLQRKWEDLNGNMKKGNRGKMERLSLFFFQLN